jgi:Arc/MetJ-type ribon-helix-helix transcriptional regulator
MTKLKTVELTVQEVEEIKELIYTEIDANDYENLSETLKELLTKLQTLK